MNIDVFDIKGKKVKSIELADSVFGVEMNEALLHGVVKAYRANRRQGTHATKTRSLVSGGGKKPFRQKGTGSARQGSSRSPLQPGGGIAHGPQPRDYREGINKKVKSEALRVALSEKAKHKKLIVVNDFSLSSYSTKEVVAFLGATGAAHNSLISDERKDDYLLKSARNIHGAEVIGVNEINAENVLRHENIVLSENALTGLIQRLGGGK